MRDCPEGTGEETARAPGLGFSRAHSARILAGLPGRVGAPQAPCSSRHLRSPQGRWPGDPEGTAGGVHRRRRCLPPAG